MRKTMTARRPGALVALLAVGGVLGTLPTVLGARPHYGEVAAMMLLALLSGVQGLRTD